jgi:hypothetical protein
MNLHQFIYAEASSTAPARTGPSLRISQTDTNTLQQLRPTERATWNSIVSYYTTNYIQRDLLSDNTLYDIKHKLEAAEGSPDLKGADISPELKSLLLRAAPIYRRYWWNGERAAGIYSLIGAAKLNDVDLEAYLRYVLERIADHPINRVEERLPWHVLNRLSSIRRAACRFSHRNIDYAIHKRPTSHLRLDRRFGRSSAHRSQRAAWLLVHQLLLAPVGRTRHRHRPKQGNY